MRRKAIAYFPLAAALAGCASMVESASQDIAFRIEPASATCLAVRATIDLNDPVETIATLQAGGAVVRVAKTSREINIRCRAPGYHTSTTTVKPEQTRMSKDGLGAIMTNAVNELSGAAFEYPGEVQIVMDPDG
ncbi:MAG: hypothetical protein BGP06_04360 [Rhizobiales bacterium 65-9]|nr:MAG: hypothetical protein BGP06_04360 [Rhizobiales bacterium 65-9]